MDQDCRVSRTRQSLLTSAVSGVIGTLRLYIRCSAGYDMPKTATGHHLNHLTVQDHDSYKYRPSLPA